MRLRDRNSSEQIGDSEVLIVKVPLSEIVRHRELNPDQTKGVSDEDLAEYLAGDPATMTIAKHHNIGGIWEVTETAVLPIAPRGIDIIQADFQNGEIKAWIVPPGGWVSSG